MCRGDPASTKIVNGDINVATDTVRAIPYVGPILEEQLNEEGLYTILDFISEFSATPGMTAKAIEKRLGELYANGNRNTCVLGNNGNQENSEPYHVSDVNQCGFNRGLDLLRFAHQNRGQYGIPQNTNIPNARRVRMRRRGVAAGPSARSVRFCGCNRTRQTCEADNCQWHSARAARLNRGVCTPNVRRVATSGFRGRGDVWPAGRANPQTSQFTRFGTQDGSAHTRVEGDFYVNRWRVPGRLRASRRARRENPAVPQRRSRRIRGNAPGLRRSRRIAAQNRLSAGAMRREILRREARTGERDVEGRRMFNRILLH